MSSKGGCNSLYISQSTVVLNGAKGTDGFQVKEISVLFKSYFILKGSYINAWLEWMIEWVNDWVNESLCDFCEWIIEWLKDCMNELLHEWLRECMIEWMYDWMN